MIYSELEQELDDFLARPNAPDEAVDGHWHVVVAQLIGELAEEAGTIDKKTMIQIIAKSVVAYDKQTAAIERFAEWAQSTISDFERSATDRINTLTVDMKNGADEVIADLAKTLPEQIKKELARDAALVRHKTTYAKRDAIIAYWCENIGADKSNEFAAELLQHKFPDVSHRTLARYIAEAKKLPPASTL